MPIRRIYFRDHHFVLTVIYGKITNAEISNHVIEMNQECRNDVSLIELADCRFITDIADLNSNQLLIAASLEKGQPRAMGGKGAIVVASDLVYAMARVYTSVAANIRSASQVFRDMDEAINWLGMAHLKDDIFGQVASITQANRP